MLTTLCHSLLANTKGNFFEPLDFIFNYDFRKRKGIFPGRGIFRNLFNETRGKAATVERANIVFKVMLCEFCSEQTCYFGSTDESIQGDE
jgi:hypothetical protein